MKPNKCEILLIILTILMLVMTTASCLSYLAVRSIEKQVGQQNNIFSGWDVQLDYED